MKFLPPGGSRPTFAMLCRLGCVTGAGALQTPKAALVIQSESGYGLLCQYPAVFGHGVLRLVR